jgi:BirA family transcriptional regulator, biotin operon repressor / biotin---[acetyl-CoA-carboxylase] ligase
MQVRGGTVPDEKKRPITFLRGRSHVRVVFGAPARLDRKVSRRTGALRLAALLADGAEHSGTSLATALGITRAGVGRRVRGLAAYGLAVSARRGRGYRLAAPLSLIEQQRVVAALRDAGSQIGAVHCFDTVASTSDLLAGRDVPPGTLVLAEHQSAGRGRRGRAWISPFGVNLYFSLSWRYQVGPAALGGLSLALGVALAECLLRHAPTVMLKWPNDLWVEGRKLGGVLVDVSGDAQGPCGVVAGIGINVNMLDPPDPPAQPWASLIETAGFLDRSALAAEVALAVEAALADFPQPGLAAYRKRWDAFDALRGRQVYARWDEGLVHGVARGIDATGALMLETPRGVRLLTGGEVSVRPCDS